MMQSIDFNRKHSSRKMVSLFTATTRVLERLACSMKSARETRKALEATINSNNNSRKVIRCSAGSNIE